MKISIYQVDAFSSKVFGGNPAAVCVLDEWLPDTLMQQIGAENNLSETAFLVKEGKDYHIRWFTPTAEVDLCGHATLASAHVLFQHLGFPGDKLTFHSKSGVLKVTSHKGKRLTLDFPATPPGQVLEPAPGAIADGLHIQNPVVHKGPFDFMVVLPTQQEVEALQPDFKTLAQAGGRGVVVTAKGDEADFISRCFYPQTGIDEDPVTGSAHTMMVPYWAEKLGKKKLTAIQLSTRKGYLDCELKKNRVLMSGYAVTYLKGEIKV
ncbi:MAG: PhzF family phenazine biosynthesis protein [Williamsia sp.]|nr:PhzF family phenazine biosynthesis protein [Williamsia sp.]